MKTAAYHAYELEPRAGFSNLNTLDKGNVN